MYQFVVSFTVQPGRRDDFVQLALRTGRDSLANEPGSKRFGVLIDEKDPDVVYLDESYADAAAFAAHAEGPYFQAFFAEAGTYAEGPVWLMRATTVDAA
jgi:(4S)-4-hydroxy-5-phosphonooxypentane-2,3-dione isomerase